MACSEVFKHSLTLSSVSSFILVWIVFRSSIFFSITLCWWVVVFFHVVIFYIALYHTHITDTYIQFSCILVGITSCFALHLLYICILSFCWLFVLCVLLWIAFLSGVFLPCCFGNTVCLFGSTFHNGFHCEWNFLKSINCMFLYWSWIYTNIRYYTLGYITCDAFLYTVTMWIP